MMIQEIVLFVCLFKISTWNKSETNTDIWPLKTILLHFIFKYNECFCSDN